MRTILRTPSLFLLLALLLQILITPFDRVDFIETATQLLVVVTALGVATDTRGHLAVGLALAIPGTILLIASRVTETPAIGWGAYGFYLLLYMHIIRLMLRQVFLVKKVTIGTIGTALCIYVLLGSLFMLFYIPLAAVDPAAFNPPLDDSTVNPISTLNYFSFVTLTTLGYGDIQPVSGLARSLAVLEALAGVFFLAVLISRLVGSYKASDSD